MNASTTYSYQVKAVKNGVESDWSNSVSATTWNRLPTADAGDNQFIVIGNSVNLNGAGSSDPDGDPITYRWDYKGSTNDNLVSRWYFDENSGNIAYDTSGVNDNDGILKLVPLDVMFTEHFKKTVDEFEKRQGIKDEEIIW